MAAGKVLQCVNEKDQGADLQQPKSGEGKAEGQAELKQGGSEKRGETVDKVEGAEFQIHHPRKKEEAERDGYEGGDEVGTAACGEKGSAVETVGQGTKKDGVQHSLADFRGDLKIVIGRLGDGLHHQQNGVVGEDAGEGVIPDRFAATENRAPKHKRNQKGKGAESGPKKVIPAVGELALQTERKDSRKGAERGGHRLRRR